MKKVLLGAGVFACSLLVLTGCGGGDSGKKLTCTADFEEDGHKYTGEVVAKLDSDDKIKDASMSMTFENTDDADEFYNSYQMIISFAKQFAEEGQEIPEIDIKKSGKTITISDFAAFYEMNSSEEDTEQEKIIGMSKDDFIKKLESDSESQWSCK